MIPKETIRLAIGAPLFESEKLACCITDTELNFVYTNKAFTNITGYTEDEVFGKSMGILLSSRFLKLAHLAVSQTASSSKRAQLDNWVITHKDGQSMEATIEVSSISIDGKRYELIVAVDMTQITNKKIRSSEKKYHVLTESLPHILWSADQNMQLNYMNATGLQYFGRTEADLEDWDWAPFIHPDEQEELLKIWVEVLTNKVSHQALHRLKRHDGKFHWFQVNVFPQFDNEVLTSWTAVYTNVHDRFSAVEELRLANTRLRSLIDASPIAIYSINTKGIVQDFWNPAAERMIGFSKEEVKGKFLPHVREEHRDEFFRLVDKTKEMGQLTAMTKRKDRFEKEITIEITGGCIYDEQGEVTEILVTVMDVTEIEENRARLRQSLAEKETLLQEIHHRVKNNLAIVVSLLQLQVFRSTNEEERFRLTEAQNRVLSISMVHELLYQSDEFNKVDLHTYYEKLISTIKSNMQLGDTTVNHELFIDLDSLNINQAIPLGLLVNELVTNSLKYAFSDSSEDNKISLKIITEENDIHVTYMDNGGGFDLASENFSSGLGMKIIDSLLSQLQAKYTIKTTDHFSIDFKFAGSQKGPHSNLS